MAAITPVSDYSLDRRMTLLVKNITDPFLTTSTEALNFVRASDENEIFLPFRLLLSDLSNDKKFPILYANLFRPIGVQSFRDLVMDGDVLHKIKVTRHHLENSPVPGFPKMEDTMKLRVKYWEHDVEEIGADFFFAIGLFISSMENPTYLSVNIDNIDKKKRKRKITPKSFSIETYYDIYGDEHKWDPTCMDVVEFNAWYRLNKIVDG